MDKTIYDYLTYKAYLRHRFGDKSSRRGEKIAAAKAINCQPTFISQILHAHAHLSLEQADALNHYWKHSDEESLFFILLVQKDRAGTKSLIEFFQNQIDEVIKRRLTLTQRLGAKNKISEQDQSEYYSSWIYSAAHIATTIPFLQTRETIAHHLNIPIQKINGVLEFLISIGVVGARGNKYIPGKTEIRLGNDSKNIIRHHSQWRQQAIDSLDREGILDLHYSGVFSLSKSDLARIKDLLLESIRSATQIVRDSKEEELCCMNMDLFNLKKGF
ncbi:MAG: hypothetical protein A4S09_13515 [Proteobacteria bacterium SG_bin7]|nr:MAG: hypothetical protein A4S09_13515 [Proteobacteria bacterium SG_bin7]